MADSMELERKLDAFLEVVSAVKQDVSNSPPAPSERVGDPLKTIADIASLWHTQTTKTAVSFKPPVALRAASQCIEGFASLPKMIFAAFQGINDEQDGILVRQEARLRILDLLTSQLKFIQELKEVPISDSTLQSSTSNGTLVAIGEVWECCEILKCIHTIDNSRLIQSKLSGYSSIIQDGLVDLSKWLEPENEVNSGDGYEEEPNDEMQHITTDTYKQLAKLWADKLSKLSCFYCSIAEGRCSILSNFALNHIAETAYALSELVDDLIGSFLEMADEQGIFQLASQIDQKVRSLVDTLLQAGQEDHFVDWIQQFSQDFF